MPHKMDELVETAPRRRSTRLNSTSALPTPSRTLTRRTSTSDVSVTPKKTVNRRYSTSEEASVEKIGTPTKKIPPVRKNGTETEVLRKSPRKQDKSPQKSTEPTDSEISQETVITKRTTRSQSRNNSPSPLLKNGNCDVIINTTESTALTSLTSIPEVVETENLPLEHGDLEKRSSQKELTEKDETEIDDDGAHKEANDIRESKKSPNDRTGTEVLRRSPRKQSNSPKQKHSTEATEPPNSAVSQETIIKRQTRSHTKSNSQSPPLKKGNSDMTANTTEISANNSLTSVSEIAETDALPIDVTLENGGCKTTKEDSTEKCEMRNDESLHEDDKRNVGLKEINSENEGNSEDLEYSETEDLDKKIDRLLLEPRSDSDSDDEEHQHPFISSMAEEGEEDTPSEGSNDIVDIGEEINTTESELSSDESYENNSFMDDNDDQVELLSGEEYDLSLDTPEKKSRIIRFSSGSDDEVVQKITKRKKEKKDKPTKKRKSRIIKFSDSSDEDVQCVKSIEDDKSGNSNVSQDGKIEEKINIIENLKLPNFTTFNHSGQTTNGSFSLKATGDATGINHIKKNRRNRKRKHKTSRNKNVSSEPEHQTTNGSFPVEIADISLSQEKHEINCLNSSVNDMKKKRRNRKRKRKTSNNKNTSPVSEQKESTHLPVDSKINNSDEYQTVQSMGNMNKKRKLVIGIADSGRAKGIVDEAISNSNMSKKIYSHENGTPIFENWSVKEVNLKPSSSAKTSETISEPINAESNQTVNFKFGAKDFKNIMLFKSSRVRRMNTKQLVRKKGYNVGL